VPKIFEKLIAPLAWSVSSFIQREIRKSGQDIIAAIREEGQLARALQRFHNLDDRTIRFEHNGIGVSLHIPDGDFDLLQRDIVIWKRFFESEWLEHVRLNCDLAGKTIVDVGANIGNHTVFFSKICGAARCLAFEPSASLFRILERNIELNQLTSVEAFPLGLSDRAEPLYYMTQPSDNLGHTSFAHEGSGPAVSARRIDDLGLDRLDFLKIDVEGMADKVLRGAATTLARCRPMIMVELFPDELANAERELHRLGYGRTHAFNAENFLYSPNARRFS